MSADTILRAGNEKPDYMQCLTLLSGDVLSGEILSELDYSKLEYNFINKYILFIFIRKDFDFANTNFK